MIEALYALEEAEARCDCGAEAVPELDGECWQCFAGGVERPDGDPLV